MLALDNPFAKEFRNATDSAWRLPPSKGGRGKKAGEVRAAGAKGKSATGGEKAGNYVFVSVHEAG